MGRDYLGGDVADLSNWIGGLMAEMTNQVQPRCFSIIPYSTINDRYIRLDRYVLQYDERGNKIGYILHGAIHYGKPLVISQAAIIYEKWAQGYGKAAFDVVLSRAQKSGCPAIWLRCADDLPALQFWQSLGFIPFSAVSGANNRTIIRLVYPLKLWLFDANPHP